MCNTKISNNHTPEKPENRRNLDTLAQLTKIDLSDGKIKLCNRQKAKAITLAQLYPLIDVKSHLEKSYWRTYHCNNTLYQDGYKYTTRYCNGRWCTVCNRIRMAKMINAYSVPLMKLKNLQFVTLTAPNVKGEELRDEIGRMYKNWRSINQSMRQTHKMDIKGIRKLECTYNHKLNSFNPHFHFLIEGREQAEKLVELWLKKNPEASPKAQDIRHADKKSLLELFKYTVKGVHKGKYNPDALDQIYQALYGKRTYQNFGIAKMTTEDVDELKADEITFKGYRHDMWSWSKECKDWVNADGELLTEMIIEGKLSDWIDDITKTIKGEIVEPEQERTLITLDRVESDDVLWSYYSEMADIVIDSS